MVNNEAAEVLFQTAKQIQRWASKGDVPNGKETELTRRAHENAWRAVTHLIPVLEHVKESDMYWKLVDTAEDVGKSEKEQRRLYTIAKQEDRDFMLSKAELEKMMEEAILRDKLDPRGLTIKADAMERRKSIAARQAFDSEVKALNKEFAKKAVTAKSKKEVRDRSDALYKAHEDAQDVLKDEMEAVYLKVGLTPRVASQKFLDAQKKAQKAAGAATKHPAERVQFWQTPRYLAMQEARRNEREAELKFAAAQEAAKEKAALKGSGKPAPKNPSAKRPSPPKSGSKKAA